jgi:SAM-dependent MidA family methyltransferase
MQKSFDLPKPSAEAARHSAELSALIRGRISKAGGSIDFSQYMELALYEPGLGYYSAGARKFGASGDFVTAPEISPLFSRCIGRVAADYLSASRESRVLEIGAGTGAMAADIMVILNQRGAAPERYSILEVSGDLKERQRVYLQTKIPEQFHRFEWLDEFPRKPIEGVILANEVLDALPVDRFVVEQGRVYSLEVADGPTGLRWCRGDASDALRESVAGVMSAGGPWPSPYCSEIHSSLSPWLASLCDSLQRGLVLFVDYGLPRREYYYPDRCEGTLVCHYRHRAHDDPFFYPGLQDITAWVDFTAVAEAAEAAGMRLAAYTTQAQFLMNAGVDLLVGGGNQDPIRDLEAARDLRTLMMPGEMGEHFKVMALTRGSVSLPESLGGRDFRYRL